MTGQKESTWLPEVDATAAEPLYRQIAAQAAIQIQDGRLPAGTRLPAARDLACRLRINPVTAVTAYRHFVRQGLVVSRVGRGTHVAGASGGGNGQFPLATLKRIMNGVLERDGEAAFAVADGLGHEPLRVAIRRYLASQGITTAGADVAVFSGA